MTVGFYGLLLSAQAQEVRARVSGLETDSVYMSLLWEEQLLKHREDSLRGKVREERAGLVADSTNLYARSQQILKMEEDIFNIRNQSGVVASRINNIEQEFILNNLMQPGKASVTTNMPTSNHPNLIDNDYFRENLTAGEYGELKSGERQDTELEQLVGEYRTTYERLAGLASDYEAAPGQAVSDSVYAVYRNVLAQLNRTEKAFAGIWDARYDQEIYLYSYLLDKLNRMDELSDLNEKGRMMRSSDSKETMSAALADYPAQRALLIEYQQALARALNLTAASDSLERAARATAAQAVTFPKITVAEKEYVRYEPVSFPSASPYDAEHPIPEFTVPESGTCYSVMVGAFSQKQAISVFRGAAPVYYERLRNGQWRYYIGLFRSYGDAADAVQELKDVGFRRPEAVRWKDGIFENLATQATQNAGLWRIVISTPDGELSGDAREQLDRYARSKEITRAAGKFYVGTFTNRLHVDDVLQALDKVEGIEAGVEEIGE